MGQDLGYSHRPFTFPFRTKEACVTMHIPAVSCPLVLLYALFMGTQTAPQETRNSLYVHHHTGLRLC